MDNYDDVPGDDGSAEAEEDARIQNEMDADAQAQAEEQEYIEHAGEGDYLTAIQKKEAEKAEEKKKGRKKLEDHEPDPLPHEREEIDWLKNAEEDAEAWKLRAKDALTFLKAIEQGVGRRITTLEHTVRDLKESLEAQGRGGRDVDLDSVAVGTPKTGQKKIYVNVRTDSLEEMQEKADKLEALRLSMLGLAREE